LKRRYVLAFFQKLPSCLVGIEACGSVHHWSRELQALGHTVRLIPPITVRGMARWKGNTGNLGRPVLVEGRAFRIEYVDGPDGESDRVIVPLRPVSTRLDWKPGWRACAMNSSRRPTGPIRCAG
jgi:hypothetical protein